MPGYPDRKRLQRNYRRAERFYGECLELFVKDVKAGLSSVPIHYTVKHRVKSFDSYYGKLLRRLAGSRKSGVVEPVHDVLAVRIVCPFLEDCSIIEKQLVSVFRVCEVERKGVRRTFREFGYDSTHFVLWLPNPVPAAGERMPVMTVEVQVRTILQDAWAEVEHELVYKKDISPLDEPLRRKLAALNANLTLSDIIFQELRDYQGQLRAALDKRRMLFAQKIALADEETAGSVAPVGKTFSGAARDADLDTTLLAALSAHNRKDYDTAVEMYTFLLSSEIEGSLKGTVYIHRGMAYYSKRELALAVQDFRRATRCLPQEGRAYYHLAVTCNELNRKKTAVRALRKSVACDPYSVKSLLLLSRLLLESDAPAQAREFCENALRIEPDSSEAHLLHALLPPV